jgi:hypothetical protein
MARQNWRDIESPLLTAEQTAVKLYDGAKGKAKARNLEFNLQFNTVLGGVKAGRCAMTGIPFDMRQKPAGGADMPFRASLDRIDNTVGYLNTNIQIVVKMYNNAKWAWNDEDVIYFAEAIMEQQYVRQCPFRTCRKVFVVQPQIIAA